MQSFYFKGKQINKLKKNTLLSRTEKIVPDGNSFIYVKQQNVAQYYHRFHIFVSLNVPGTLTLPPASPLMSTCLLSHVTENLGFVLLKSAVPIAKEE